MPITAIAPGTVLAGRYRLGQLLGRGGMAEVYDGLDLRLERAVAVKLLQPEMAARDDIRTRFEAEARSAAGLSHPNAVAVYDTGEHDGVPWLVMERLPGTTLADRIETGGPVDPAWMVDAATGVLGALGAAHATGIVHRDVKPGNILIAADGTAKITDFGIAKSFHPDEGVGAGTAPAKDLTATGQLVGTPAYLAPERIEGKPANPCSDLWALGVVMYEALAGAKPFDGRGPLDVAHAVVTGRHVPLGERRPDLDPRLVATVERAMSIEPEDRFASAEEMATALRGGRVAAATIAGPPKDRTSVLTEAPIPASVGVPPRPRPARARRAGSGATPAGVRRGRLFLVAAAALLVLLLFLVGRGNTSGTQAASQSPTTVKPVTTSQAATPTTLTAQQSLAKSMRAFAAGLTTAKDGQLASQLADGLNTVASSLESGATTAAAGQATGLIISASVWNQTGQLSSSAMTGALSLLQQVPGVQVPSLNAATPPAPAPSPANTGKAKGKDKGNEH